jgi:hypothetical protein
MTARFIFQVTEKRAVIDQSCPKQLCGCEQTIPLLHEEGCLRHKLMLRSLISGAGGVVEPAGRCQHARPPRPLHQMRLRGILFMSRPPLLVEEGNACSKAGRQIYRLSKTHVCSESQGIMHFGSWTGLVIDRTYSGGKTAMRKTSTFRCAVAGLLASLITFGLLSCSGGASGDGASGAKLDGVYHGVTGGPITITIKDGKATVQIANESKTLDYKVEGKKLTIIDPKEGNVEFTINDDGTLTGELGVMTKKSS